MTQNSRELVTNLFEGKPVDRLPFMPWVCSFAAKLEQVPVKMMLTDPGILTRALSNAQKLFGYDAILTHFDPSLEAEACGCEVDWPDDTKLPLITTHPLEDGGDFYDLDTVDIETKGRLPYIFEAASRLILTKGKEVPIAAMVTGPLTLAMHLKGETLIEDLEDEDDEALDLIEDTGNFCLKLCRMYCELGVDIVVIAEDLKNSELSDVKSVLSSPLKSIFNVARFYNISSVLAGRARSEEQAEALFELTADAVSVSGIDDTGFLAEKAAEAGCVFSLPVPDTACKGNTSLYPGYIRSTVDERVAGMFLSSEWELPFDTDVTTLHAIMNLIRGA